MPSEALYSPIQSEQDDEISQIEDSKSDLLPKSRHLAHQRWPRPSAKRRWNAVIAHGALGLLNIAILLALVYLHFNGPYQRQGLIYSPAWDAVEYETRTFNTSLFSRNRYNGYPNNQSSAAWEELTSHENVIVSKEELKRLNRTSVEVSGSGYLVTLGVFHQIHCLDYIRRRLYPEYYPPDEDERTQKVHTAHCIDNLRQIIQCHGDTSVLTYSWRPDYANPWPDFQIQHECRNFDKLVKWADSRRTKITSKNMVNPLIDKERDWNGTTPTEFENATELIGGTRELGITAQEDY